MRKSFSPFQSLIYGFTVLVLIGTVLLRLPVSAAGDRHTSLVDALFTSASAVCTVGLVVVDTGSHFSLFGQTVILALFQIGGLGYMLFIALLVLGVGANFSVTGRLLLSESLSKPSHFEIRKFVSRVVFFVAAFEILGAVLLTWGFSKNLPWWEALYSGVFHSVSAFCTAGFSLYPDSFTAYAGDALVQMAVVVVALGGGIGFFVLYDLAHYARSAIRRSHPRMLTDHSKMVLWVSALLMGGGAAALFVSEGPANASVPMAERLLSALFHSVSASTTTGFNSVDIGSMSSPGLAYLLGLMFIGASPGSTGGGIKTVSFAIILLFLRSVALNRENVTVFHRTIVPSTVKRALGVGLFAGLYIAALVLILADTETAPLQQIAFEAVAALSSGGLSTGITPFLSTPGKLLLVMTMLIGRVGPLAIGYSLVARVRTKRYQYPSGNVMVS